MIDIKQGDTRHAIQATLKNTNGDPVNLTGTTVRFFMGKVGQIVIENDARQTEVPGEVWYVFNEGETDVPGFYNVEFRVTYADGKVETFPHNQTLKLRIHERIGGI